MMLLQIQCHFGLAPIDVVAVALDISWPQLWTSAGHSLSSCSPPFCCLLPRCPQPWVLGFAFIWERAQQTASAFSYSTSLLLPRVATWVHKLEVFSNFKVLFCYLVLFLEVF